MSKRFLSILDLANLPEPKWLIEGLFEVNSLTMLAGPSGHYKSFMMIDWAMHMVTGRKWLGRETAKLKVLYCLGEGKASLLKRLEAWQSYHRATPEERQMVAEGFKVTFEVPQLADPTDVTRTLSQLVVEDFKPDLIVFDTFARSFVGKDENDAKDTGVWIEAADKLRQNGYTVMFLHHTNKNTEFGYKYRGSSAILGAMDSAFTLAKCKDEDGGPNNVELVCTKQKDHDDGLKLWFARHVVEAEGGSEGSMVLVPVGKPVKMDASFVEAQNKESERDRLVADLLADASFESDRARARALVGMTELTEMAAQSRIKRARESRLTATQGATHLQSVAKVDFRFRESQNSSLR